MTEPTRYPVILADPPWKYDDTGSRMAPGYSGKGRAEAHYEPMELGDICAAGAWVQQLAEDDCLLFLWITGGLLIEGIAAQVARAWGFVAKHPIDWHKVDADGYPRLGGGHYARICTEYLVLCRRGKAKVARHDMPNVIIAPRSKHSAKPDASYHYIERLTGATRFLDLYARRQFSPRWTAWGDQAPAEVEAARG